MEKDDVVYTLGVLLLIAAIAGGLYYDQGVLSPRVLVGDLIDKEARTSCTPVMPNSNGISMGEVCSTDYLLHVRSGGQLQTLYVVERIYGDFAVGDRLQRTWDNGRLGFPHNVRYSHPKIE
jgi:hypothetical protein